MDLKTALYIRDISRTDAARILGVSREHLTRVVNGRAPAGRKLALKIQKEWPEIELITLLADAKPK